MSKSYVGSLGAVFALCALAAGCSGGSVVAPPVPAQGIAYSGLALTVPLVDPSVTGSVAIPNGTALPNDVFTVVTTSTAPAGAPTLAVTTNVPLLYIEVTFSQTTTLNGIPAFSFATGTLVNPANGALYIALLDPTKMPLEWQLAEGPGTVNGGSVFLAGTTTPLTFAAGQTTTFALCGCRD